MTKLKLNLQKFGANASKSTNLYSSGYPSSYPYTLTASLVENSTNTANNTSNITIKAVLKANNQRWSTSYNSTLQVYWYDNNTGVETLKATTTFAGLETLTSSKEAVSTFNVTHKNDGTLSGYVKAVFTKGSTTSPNAPSSGNVQTNLTALTSIARVSIASITSPYVGDTAIITLNRSDSSYTDTITYTIGTLTGTIATKTSGTTFSLDTSALASSIYTEMGATNTSMQGTITIETFNANDVSLGTYDTTFNLYAKESDCKPSIDFDVITTDNLSLTLSGNNTTIISYISNTSLSYTATPKNGATISRKYMVDYSDLPPSPVTNWLIYTSSLTMVAIDSRGFQNYLTKQLNYIDYFSPSIDLQTYRTAPASTEIKANFQGTFFNDTFGSVTNSLTLTCKYRIKGDTNWTTLRTLVENTDYTIDNNTFYSGTGSVASDIVLDSNVFSYSNIYEIGIFYQDAIVDTYTSRYVPKGVPVVNWEDEHFNVNGDLTISDADGQNPINLLKLYSTSEKQIGYWTDDKPVYRKVVDFGTLPNNTTKNVAHNISNLKDVVRLEGIASYTAGGNKGWMALPLQYTGNNYVHNVQVSASTTNITITSNSDRSSYSAYVIIEYTKTTD